MIIDKFLFYNGNIFNVGNHNLQRHLFLHESHIKRTINEIYSIDEMTETFLHNLVKSSIVEPLIIHFDLKTQKMRKESFYRREMPLEFCHLSDGPYDKTVARISIPFSGDTVLLELAPNSVLSCFPKGEVNGKSIQFDVVLWGYEDDNKRVKREIEMNLGLLRDFSKYTNDQIKQFNEMLPKRIEAAFKNKFQELSTQLTIFEELGIKEAEHDPDPQLSYSNEEPFPHEKVRQSRQVLIIQSINNMYVQTLNQINYNSGDVNNAILSNE